MATRNSEIVQGTLDLLILKTISAGHLHGYGIAQRILAISNEVLRVQQGSLYPALHRLERKGLIEAQWKESGNGPMAKYYSLTPSGRKELDNQVADWQRYAGAIALVLQS